MREFALSAEHDAAGRGHAGSVGMGSSGAGQALTEQALAERPSTEPDRPEFEPEHELPSPVPRRLRAVGVRIRSVVSVDDCIDPVQ